jgi:hypothetical protein
VCDSLLCNALARHLFRYKMLMHHHLNLFAPMRLFFCVVGVNREAKLNRFGIVLYLFNKPCFESLQGEFTIRGMVYACIIRIPVSRMENHVQHFSMRSCLVTSPYFAFYSLIRCFFFGRRRLCCMMARPGDMGVFLSVFVLFHCSKSRYVRCFVKVFNSV